MVDEAEGHAICLDEDLNEDVEIKGAKRCFRIAGTQEDIWYEVWKVKRPDSSGDYTHYRIPVGSIAKGEGPGGDESYIAWGSRIKYLALVQDNDKNENFGLSVFRNLKLYNDKDVRNSLLLLGIFLLKSFANCVPSVDAKANERPRTHHHWRLHHY